MNGRGSVPPIVGRITRVAHPRASEPNTASATATVAIAAMECTIHRTRFASPFVSRERRIVAASGDPSSASVSVGGCAEESIDAMWLNTPRPFTDVSESPEDPPLNSRR
jgi:hypothetical protein